MHGRARSRRRLLMGAFLGLFIGGCLSPTLPLPPPARPSVEGPTAQGTVRLTGTVSPNARAYAFNRSTDRINGQQTGSDGAYDIEMQAQVGHEIEFWYVRGSEESQSIVFRIEARGGGGDGAGGSPIVPPEGGAAGAGGADK